MKDLEKTNSENLNESLLKNEEIKLSAQSAQSARGTFEEESQNEVLENVVVKTPLIPNEIFIELPCLLQEGCKYFYSKRERDVFLTSALSVLSGCFNNITGTYDQKTMAPNLYSFIIAPAASGKGVLFYAKELGMAIHRTRYEASKEKRKQHIELQKKQATANKKNKDCANAPLMPLPPYDLLFIPANASTAKLIAHLEQLNGRGIICETEADTMGNSFKQDWGGYSDLLRKAFHHETISYSRKGNDEYIEVEKPFISVALSGTPSQVAGLIKSAEDGLFSRFIFYSFKEESTWKDVSPANKVNLTNHFIELSNNVKELVEKAEKSKLNFNLTDQQWLMLNLIFKRWLVEVSTLVGEEAESSIKRLGLIAFRIAMILSVIRHTEQGIEGNDLVCGDIDFNTALKLVEVYKEHAMVMFKKLPKSSSSLGSLRSRFFNALPGSKSFKRADAVLVGESIGIAERTTDKYLNILRGKNFLEYLDGIYKKVAMQGVQTMQGMQM